MARSVTTSTVVAEPISIACEMARSPLSAKKSMYAKTTAATRKSTIQTEVGMIPDPPWIRSRRASSRSDVWSSHLRRQPPPLRLEGSNGCSVRKSASPHGIDRVARVPRLHLGPLAVNDRAPVADDLTAQALAHARREELRGLELLHHRQRLALGAASRLVVAREGEEDDEPGEDREPGRQHAEDARGTVAVREVTAFRRPPANEQQRADRDRDGGHEDHEAREQAHRRRSRVRTRSRE